MKSFAQKESSLRWDSPSVQVLFQLLRIALGKEKPTSLPNDVNWQEVYDLSMNQGVGAIACDGMLAIENCGIDEELKYKWMGQSMVIEQKYYQQRGVIAQLSDFYGQKGIRMMLLKGYGLSLNYPRPEHRPTGDIDIFLKPNGLNSEITKKNAWWKGDDVIRQLGIKVDTTHEHHTVFRYLGQLVENHYDIVNTKGTRSSAYLDFELKRLVCSDCKIVRVVDSIVEIPGDIVNAVFIIRHMGQHFAGSNITLRHLLDWVTFIDTCDCTCVKNGFKWKEIVDIWERIGVIEFVKCINSICVDFLGVNSTVFHDQLSEKSDLTIRVLNDILSRKFTYVKKKGLFLIIVYKVKRFYSNRWKRRMVYREGVLEQFFFGSIAHLMRLKTIKD